MKRVYVCTDNLTGIFSAIYDAWKTKLTENEVGIALRGSVEQELFCEYVEIRDNEKKAIAVENLIKRHLESMRIGIFITRYYLTIVRRRMWFLG